MKTNLLMGMIALIALCVGGCDRSRDHTIRLALEVPQGVDHLILERYGAHRVTTETLAVKDGWVRYESAWNRDTMDALLVKDPVGRLLLPLFPSSYSLSVQTSKGNLQAEGVDDVPLLAQFYHTFLRPSQENSAEDLQVLKDYSSSRAGYLYAFDRMESVHRSEDRRMLDSLLRNSTKVGGDVSEIFGILIGPRATVQEGEYLFFSLPLHEEKEGYITTSSLAEKSGKALLMCIPPLDSPGKIAYRKTISSLDSLGVSSYAFFPRTFEGSKSLEVKNLRCPHYTVLDTKDQASGLVEQLSIPLLPYYIGIDSLGMVSYTASSEEELFAHLQGGTK